MQTPHIYLVVVILFLVLVEGILQGVNVSRLKQSGHVKGIRAAILCDMNILDTGTHTQLCLEVSVGN